MASVKVFWVERVFSSRKVSALARAVLIFWEQGQKIPKFLCQASTYWLTWTTPTWHSPRVSKIKGGKKNDLMETDGVSLKQIILGEAAEHNRRSENEVVQIGSRFFLPLSFHLLLEVFRFVSACHVRPSLQEEEALSIDTAFIIPPQQSWDTVTFSKGILLNKTITSRKIIKLPK